MELRDSITKENLLRAFAGESQARNRYTFAADVCCQNKMQALEQIFLYTAGQEKEHAEIYYNHLVKGGCENITITANYPIDLSQQPLILRGGIVPALHGLGSLRVEFAFEIGCEYGFVDRLRGHNSSVY